MSNYPPPPPNQGPPPGGPPQYGGPPGGYPGGPPQGPGGPQYPGPPGGPPGGYQGGYPGGPPPPGGGGGISGKVIALIVAAVVIVAGLGVVGAVALTGDDDGGGGGDADDAPANATTEEFCDGISALEEEDSEELSPEEEVDRAHEIADDLAEIGTPEGMPDDAREGFEIYVAAIKDVDVEKFEELENLESDDEIADALGISQEDQEKVEAFFEYTVEECFESQTGTDAPGGAEAPTDLPTDELPTDFPTDELPTDFPTDFSLPTDFTFPTE